jgi:hypothetical protein
MVLLLEQQMDPQVKYDRELYLMAPTGGVLKSILVTVEIEPEDAGCLIYGTAADGSTSFVEATGAKTDIELPFAHPRIYLKYSDGTRSVQIATKSYKEAARS